MLLVQHSTKKWGFVGHFILSGEKMRNKQENTGRTEPSREKMWWHYEESQAWREQKLVMILCSELDAEHWQEGCGKVLHCLTGEKGESTMFVEVGGGLISWDNSLALCKHDDTDATAKLDGPWDTQEQQLRGKQPSMASQVAPDTFLTVGQTVWCACLWSRWIKRKMVVEADVPSVILDTVKHLPFITLEVFLTYIVMILWLSGLRLMLSVILWYDLV